jgi:hypothetical protein
VHFAAVAHSSDPCNPSVAFDSSDPSIADIAVDP